MRRGPELQPDDDRQPWRDGELQFRSLLEMLPAGAYTCDADGLITYFNRHAVELWGREPKLCDPVDRFCGSVHLYSPDGSPIAHDQCWTALAIQEGKSYVGQEVVVERPDGSRLTALAHASPIRNEAGHVVGAVNVLVDISDRRRAEETQRRAAEALREADRRKDEFLATLAHELRSPLAPICNSLHLLRLSDDLSPAVRHVREIMERQVSHMVRLVDDLLEVARITQGKIELRKDVVELSAVIGSAVETSRPLIEAAGHQLALSFPAEPLLVEADPVRLAQVVANLLNNAAKYTPSGGQIWLTAHRDGGQALVTVRDNGQGISADMLPRVFDMFAQMDHGRSGTQSGLGIGLALAKRLIEMHGGRIDAYSAGIDCGSEFVVSLPLAVGVSSVNLPSEADRRPAVATQPRRILVVDDTESSAYILGQLLESMGQQVRTSDNAEAALKLAHAHRPHVIISDIAMPGMDGCELARRLRSEPGLENVVLVALTGYGQDHVRERAEDAGFDHYLVKPVSVEDLEYLLASLPLLSQSDTLRLGKGV